VRLIGALLAEQNEVWQARRYLDMDEFREWPAEQNKPLDSARLIAINSWQKQDLLNRIYSRFWA
jgi:hypothetical protein